MPHAQSAQKELLSQQDDFAILLSRFTFEIAFITYDAGLARVYSFFWVVSATSSPGVGGCAVFKKRRRLAGYMLLA